VRPRGPDHSALAERRSGCRGGGARAAGRRLLRASVAALVTVVAACGQDPATDTSGGSDAAAAATTAAEPAASSPGRELAATAGPLPGTQFSAPVVQDADGSYLYNGWERGDGGEGWDRDQPSAGVPTIMRHVPATGSDETLVTGGFAPVPLAAGAFAYARIDAGVVEPLARPPSDVVVREPDGTDGLVLAGGGRTAFPVFAIGDGLLVQILDADGSLETGMLTAEGTFVTVGLPLAVSPDRAHVLTTLRDAGASQLLELVDGSGTAKSGLDRASYAAAFLDAAQRATWDPATPVGPENPVPLAQSSPGAWVGETIVLPASRGLLWLTYDGNSLRGETYSALDPSIDARDIVQVGRVWPDGSDAVLVTAVVIDVDAAQAAAPPSTLTVDQARDLAERQAEDYRQALQNRTYRCSLAERRCQLTPGAIPPPWLTGEDD
jgi:hypothetical protein